MRFRDRRDAGSLLCRELEYMKGKDALVLAIARGGVVVGDAIAECIGATLDVIVPRKIGSPYNPELALGAVMHDGKCYINEHIARMLDVKQGYIQSAKEERMRESVRMLMLYRGSTQYSVRGRHVVLVDDGIATGATVLVSIAWCRDHKPASITLAVPVMPSDVYEVMRREVDRIAVLLLPVDFGAVGEFYDDFSPVSDEHIMDILGKYKMR
ncbi:MAG: phosphoribosyltransferase family protein [Candidatus Nitrosocaldus sp.]|nr:phosphoribosyltransferase family protein [Candidatus Nitrosocaldus sp.]MDW8276210.1 phosphoribosyltransferase family protein [Candidatus Nitrosocaldus sp.]